MFYLFALLYRLFYKLHHALCLRPGKALQKSRLVVVGSYRIGGAGKTPVALELAKRYAGANKTVAILVHGVAFDEELLLERKIAECGICVQVVRTGNRYKTAHELDGKFDVILCDDGFEDSRLVPDEKILLDWEDPCTRIGDLWLNGGKCRSLRQDHKDITKVLKCGTDVKFCVASVTPILPRCDALLLSSVPRLLTFCGLGDPGRFAQDVDSYLRESSLQPAAEHIACKDHDRNFAQKLRRLLESNPDSAVIISEKDSCRLENADFKGERVFVAVQKVAVQNFFI